jgi:hypothetical protein
VSEDEVVAFRMLEPECNKICGIEIVRGPFALDGCWSLSLGRDDKVHLVTALVAPIEYFPALRARHNFIQYEMLPQCPKVIIPQVLPASVVANETGIEAIDFRRSHYLSGPASAEGANDMSDERCLKNTEVVCDGWPAYLARIRLGSPEIQGKIGQPPNYRDPGAKPQGRKSTLAAIGSRVIAVSCVAMPRLNA